MSIIGDILQIALPKSEGDDPSFARSLANLEAIIGQFYIAMTVADGADNFNQLVVAKRARRLSRARGS